MTVTQIMVIVASFFNFVAVLLLFETLLDRRRTEVEVMLHARIGKIGKTTCTKDSIASNI